MARSNGTKEAKVVYALIDGRWNPENSVVDDGNSPPPSSYCSTPLPPTPPPQPGADGSTGEIVALTTAEQWYEYYARRYPSRGFLHELERQREELEDERERQEQLLMRERKKPGGGWLRRLFFGGGGGSSGDATAVHDDDKNAHDNDNDNNALNSSMDDEFQGQQFTDRIEDGMCGTTAHINEDAITQEALAFHRFHLVSERRALCAKDRDHWNVVLPVRQSVGWDDLDAKGDGKTPFYCIVGYGKIAEFPSLDAATASGSNGKDDPIQGAKVTLTSDWQHLVSLGNCDGNDVHAPPHDLRHCRAASIGRDCLMVSWGRNDGWIIFYHRIQRPQQQEGSTKKSSSKNTLKVGWEVICAASPSKAVIHAASKNLSQNPYNHDEDEEDDEMQQRRLYDSGSLFVTDLMPMVVNNDNVSQQHPREGHHQSPSAVPSSAVLAISRLGGYVELLPLPNWIWLPDDRKSKPTASPASSRKDFLPNLTASSKTTAFSTSQHHVDVMSMDAYRTHVGADSEWDEKRRPEGPPAELILAVCGRSSDAKAAVTLWGITAIHSFPQKQDGSVEEDVPTFDLRLQRISYLSLDNVGANSSLFLSDVTADHWVAGQGASRASKKRKFTTHQMPCSITTAAPLVSLRFTPRDLSVPSSNCVLLAALDYNGGVSVIDCTESVRSAEHMDLSSEDPTIHLICDREATMSVLSKGIARSSQIEWWSHSFDGSFTLATYAALIRSGKNGAKAIIRLQQWASRSEGNENKMIANRPSEVFCIPISSNIGSVALLPMSHQSQHETLPFIQISSARQNSSESSLPLPPHISICGVRKFSKPAEIIAALLRRGDAERALEIARRFGGAEHFGGRVMNECRIQLWEDQRDAQALKLISDNDYVLSQVTKLERCGKDNVMMDLKDLTLDDLLEVFREALARFIRLEESGADNPHWISSSISLLRKSVRRLGTFQLLLYHFTVGGSSDDVQMSSNPFTRRFLYSFQHESLYNIASCVAAKGDIEALTVLLARHPVSIRQHMTLMDLIPLGIQISLYEHLLPCHTNTESKYAHFLPKSPTQPKFLDSLQLFTYLSERQSHESKRGGALTLNVCTDNADKDNVMLHFWDDVEDAATSDPVSQDEVATWFLKRAIDIQNETGQVVLMKEACEAGLIRLGFVSFKEDGDIEVSELNNISESSKQSQAVAKLIYLYSAASFFSNILVDKMKEPLSHPPSLPIESKSEWKDLFTSLIRFCSMELSETVPFILENSNANSISIFQQQFVDGGECLEPMETGSISGDFSIRFEHEIMELCLKKFKRLQKERKASSSALQEASSVSLRLEESLSMCIDFASKCRIIESEDGLINFAQKVFRSVLEVVKGEWDFITEGVISRLWSVVELLPCTGTRNSNLHFRLVVLQLCCKWHVQQSFPPELWNFLLHCPSGQEVDSGNERTRDICMVGHSVISIMCSGFCARMVGSVDKICSPDQDLDLLCDFVSDVDEFDKRFFSSGIQESGYLGKYLVPRLLSQHSFVMLKNILKIQPTWFSQAFMHSSVVSFIRDTTSSQGNEMHVSLECQEILGPLLPNIAAELEQCRRTLEARQFMSEAMKLDPLLLGRLFSFDYADNPIVIIEALMELSPQALLLGCEFWGDERASKACADAAVYFSAQICASLNKRPAEDSDHVLPPMPGGSIVMQLGNILGLRSSHDLLLVKRYMFFGALKTRLVPAAAAICLSMLCDGALSRNENATTDDTWRWTSKHDRQVLDCVVAVVRDKSGGCVHTKRELCSLALRLFSFRDPPLNCVESFKDVEYQLIALERDSISPVTHQQGRHSSDLLLFKAVGLVARQARDFMDDISRSPNAIEGDRNDFYDQSMTRVYYDTQHSFSVDLLKFLSSTGESSSTESISEVILHWLTSEAFKARRTSLPSTLPVSNILTMMELGSSCLAELPGQDTASSIISRSMDEFKAKISQCNSNSSPDHSAQQPDLSIVQRLNARGYGMNAARRAVIMTNNQGYTEALAYAVGHFMDEDFDSPFYVLRDGSARVDRQLIAATSGFLQSAQHRFLEKKRTRLVTPSKSARSKMKPFVSKLPSPSPRESLTNGGSPISSVEGSLSDCRAVKRQIQLGSKRTQKLPPDDRQRLAMEGKRLLDAARARNKRVIAPPTSITTSRRAPS